VFSFTPEFIMAKKNGVAKLPARVSPSKTIMVPLSDIVSNVAQSRKTGVLHRLQEMGYPIFAPRKKKGQEEPEGLIWEALCAEEDPKRAAMIALIDENEPDFVAFAIGLESSGQLQPIGVRELETDKYDVIYGMRRALAILYNHARHPDTRPGEVRAEVYEEKLEDGDLLLLALKENKDRAAENPLDLALSYKEVMTGKKLTAPALAMQLGLSDQTVREYISLLDPLLENVRGDIASGKLKVAPALKLLAVRKETGDPDAKPQRNGTNGDARNGPRHKFPPMKVVLDCLLGKFPKKMEDEERELYKIDEVRQFLAYYTGTEYTPWVEPEVQEETEGEEGEETQEPIQVSHKQALALWAAIGQDIHSVEGDEELSENLSNIVNFLPEEREDLEDTKLQGLLEDLIEAYQSGTPVEVVARKAGKKKVKA
jgi:ParB/RepB/Spo0J family partition protein